MIFKKKTKAKEAVKLMHIYQKYMTYLMRDYKNNSVLIEELDLRMNELIDEIF